MNQPIALFAERLNAFADNASEAREFIRDSDAVEIDLEAGNVQIKNMRLCVEFDRRGRHMVEIDDYELADIDAGDLDIEVNGDFVVVPKSALDDLRQAFGGLAHDLAQRPLSEVLRDAAAAAALLEDDVRVLLDDALSARASLQEANGRISELQAQLAVHSLIPPAGYNATPEQPAV